MDIDNLISRYLENKCTQEEKHQLLEFLALYYDKRSSQEELFSEINEFQENRYRNQSVDFERIFNALSDEIKFTGIRESEGQLLQKRLRVKRLVLQGISVAAVFCVAFFLGTLFNNPRNNLSSEKSISSTAYNEIKAPLGAKSEIRLNDGTEVMLNAGSSLKYRNDYNLLNRDLVLEGEAYFKVARNVNLPLVVNAGNINIKATGTEFNIKAYSDEGLIETTLVTGEVEISSNGNNKKDQILVLKPNQKAIYTQQSDQLTLEKIKEIEPLAVQSAKVISDNFLVSPKTDVEQVTAWTKNKLIIRRENLESLCVKLQRKYNTTFVFRDEELKKHRFSGVLLDETLQQVIDVIKLTSPVDYIIDGKTVILFSNNEKADKKIKNLIKDKN
jgi:ferric-dicitrate binding protein FerR (iron transport regulator)